jgi:hypothetical protein
MIRHATIALGLLASTISSSALHYPSYPWLYPFSSWSDAHDDGDLWQPDVGSKWQIMIKNNLSVSLEHPLQPDDVDIWDIDLFNTPIEVISGLRRQGKKVICYFSAGSGEDWRPDYSLFVAEDLGEPLGCWPGEKWLNVRSNKVWEIMKARIKMANEKGCDAIDPDNIGKDTFLTTEKSNKTRCRWVLQWRRWL